MASKKAFYLNTDGGARPNPGPASIGVAIASVDGSYTKEISRYIGEATNNQAEYKALVIGLEELLEIGATDVTVRMDSQLIVRQISGQYRVKNQDLKPFYNEAQSLLKKFASASVMYVPREQNKLADALATKAIENRNTT
ncbi:MAG: ribonuclease HI family protein [Chloroflexi bacterium]|jgi:ribonuclease HI|nr:ribonuclease HI family protein [Chloroflexota bacterium]MBT7081504.1 ribonuclease HI family protein [Chloroflexota bacterium]MBT7290712.1 ribonuclease HI family protein [Chloroflexota bacterium]